ncbi:MAG TPA: efflux transporter outer membrane subunit [Opitutaceae bacterium]|nr:efflux transporter outer membrane subunit [Opitutaceae bacterium]
MSPVFRFRPREFSPRPGPRAPASTVTNRRRARASLLGALAAAAALAGCAVGPNYRRPPAPTPMAFKEAEGWKQAAPSDALDRGAWWTVFNDSVLDGLEQQAAVANQSIIQAAANYEQSRQLARADRATFFPTFSVSGSGQRAKSGNGRSVVTPAASSSTSGSTGTGSTGSTGTSLSVSPSSSGPTNSFSASAGASWVLDFWGRIRRQTESDVAAAQASAADLANARLSIQASVAQTYLQLRIADERVRLRQNAVNAYQRTLQIAQNKYRVGIVARSDVASAQAQLDAARAQLIDAGIQRAQLEHALAVLVGKAPGDFTVAVLPSLALTSPAIPAGLPSELLERRPDVASAERSVAAANARVGVQTAAYFPQVTLSADGGFSGSELNRLFRTPNRFWSVGANLSDTLFDFGRRRAELLSARAAYDAQVAAYRGTVLRAFQQVEDNLIGYRELETEAQVQQAAVNEAAEAARIAMNEYEAGTVDYTTVATAQVNEINNRQTALTVIQNRMNAAVALIEALGGGWRQSDLPASHAVLARHP